MSPHEESEVVYNIKEVANLTFGFAARGGELGEGNVRVGLGLIGEDQDADVVGEVEAAKSTAFIFTD